MNAPANTANNTPVITIHDSGANGGKPITRELNRKFSLPHKNIFAPRFGNMKQGDFSCILFVYADSHPFWQ